MLFEELPLKGAYLVKPEPAVDERGFFVRTFCREEFAAHGLVAGIAQASISFNRRRGTVRGMHFSSRATCRDEASALHGRCHLRRHC